VTERKPTRQQLAALDFENLMLEPRFKRFLFTVLETAGMSASDFHADSRIHAFRAGRRSLGLDILRTAEAYLGLNAMALILEAEILAQQETSNAARSDYHEQRIAELGGDDLREPGTGLTYLHYPNSGGAGDGSPDEGA
jgi:hypothetical protein